MDIPSFCHKQELPFGLPCANNSDFRVPCYVHGSALLDGAAHQTAALNGKLVVSTLRILWTRVHMHPLPIMVCTLLQFKRSIDVQHVRTCALAKNCAKKWPYVHCTKKTRQNKVTLQKIHVANPVLLSKFHPGSYDIRNLIALQN